VNDTASVATASWGRRFLALAVDWLACSLVVVALSGPSGWSDDPASGLYVLGVFVAESALFTAIAGGSFGQLATRLRVVRHDGSYGPVSLLKCVLRQLLVAVVVPPLVFRPDGRGLHDMAAGSMTVRLEDLRAL
jgi:uncharacterized RDD family membrane protein YckC